MPDRSTDAYETYLHDFLREDLWVCCPACGLKAVVKTDPEADSFHAADASKIRVSCTGCGFSRRYAEQPDLLHSPNGSRRAFSASVRAGRMCDPFFYLPLWLQTDFGGELLWAYNPAHLRFLRHHIGAALRERSGEEHANRSLGSRLPKWMLASGKREALLRKLDQLAEK